MREDDTIDQMRVLVRRMIEERLTYKALTALTEFATIAPTETIEQS